MADNGAKFLLSEASLGHCLEFWAEAPLFQKEEHYVDADDASVPCESCEGGCYLADHAAKIELGYEFGEAGGLFEREDGVGLVDERLDFCLVGWGDPDDFADVLGDEIEEEPKGCCDY